MMPLSSELFTLENELFKGAEKNINRRMIKNFLIVSFTGKNNLIGLMIDNNFFIKKFQTNIKNNELLMNNIFQFIKEKNVNIDKKFSIIINLGPGSFSGIRISLAIGKGIKISTGAKLYGYNDASLDQFNRKNIELLIKKNLIEKSLIKPVYLS